MNRTAFRLVAAALAVAVTLLKLTGIALIAGQGPVAGDTVVVLPRVIVTPGSPHDDSRRDDAQAASFARSSPLPPT